MRLTIIMTLLLASLFAWGEEGVTTVGGAPVVATESAALNPVESALQASSEVTGPAKESNKEEIKSESKKESEIPLTLEVPKKAQDETHPIFKIILVISMMGAVGTGAFIFLKKYSKTNFALGKANQIKIITQHHLGPKKSLAIIRVAGESILIGITEQNINMIKSLSLLDDEVPEATPHHFSEVFGSGKDDRNQDFTGVADAHEEDEEFSIRGVKEAVSKKLKGMRSFQ
jgi:flagellar protein FliO/FliZ